MELYKNFRHNLQLLRISKGYSAKELSSMLNMNDRRISNLEQQHIPSVDELVSISKFFNVSTDEMLHKKATVIFEK